MKIINELQREFKCNYHIVLAWVLIPLKQTTTKQFFLSPQALKNLASLPKQTKSLDNSNILHAFNNNSLQTHLNSQLCYSCDLIEPKCNKTKNQLVVWLKQAKTNIRKLSPQSHTSSEFGTEGCPPQQKEAGGGLILCIIHSKYMY